MKKKLLLPLSALLITGIALTSCSTFKQDLEKRKKDRETEPAATEMSETTEAEASDVTETEETTTEETTTEETTVEPSVITVESNMYSDEEAPIYVDWDNYQSSDKTANVFTRMSEDQIDDFEPSEEYGYVMPFIGVTSEGEVKSTYADVGEVRTMSKFGFCDSNGRIVTDAVFDGVTLLSRCYYVQKGEHPDTKYGLINLTGTVYTGCVFDNLDMTYWGEDQIIFAKTDDGMSVYDNDLNLLKTLKYDTDLGNNKYLKPDSPYFVAAVIDDTHVMLNSDFEDKQYLDISTGEIADFMPWTWYEEYNLLITSTGKGDEMTFQLRDGQGNVIADGFKHTAFNTPYPVLGDKSEKWHIFDGKGEDRYTYNPSNGVALTKLKDGLLVKIDDNNWRLLDEDFKVVDYGIRDVIRTGDDEGLYVAEGDKVKDYYSDKTIFSGYDKTSHVYVLGDVIAMSSKQSDNTYKEIVFSNGKTVNIRGARNFSFTTDKTTGKLYAIAVFEDRVQIYCVDDDTAGVIYVPIVVYASYSTLISDNKYYFMGPDVRAIYDITDLENVGTVFYYEPLVVADD